jgi:hypothetical protein
VFSFEPYLAIKIQHFYETQNIRSNISKKSDELIPNSGKENPKLKLFFIAILID